MRASQAVNIFLWSTLLVTAMGGSMGWAVGTFNPDYYRNIFREGKEPGFDPVSTGVGAGLTQGLVGGIVVGVIMVIVLTTGNVWSRSNSNEQGSHDTSFKQKEFWRQAKIIVCGVFAIVCCLGTSTLIGVFIGVQNAYNRHYLEEREVIEPILASDPAFSNLTIEPLSSGGCSVNGTVSTKADHARLREKIIQGLGEERVVKLLDLTFVDPSPTDSP